MVDKAFENVLELERRVQRSIVQSFSKIPEVTKEVEGKIVQTANKVPEVKDPIGQAFQNVLELERRAQRPVIQAISKFVRRTQGQASELYNKDIAPIIKNIGPRPPAPPPPPTTPLVPIEVNGFYTVTGPQEVTFYASTNNALREAVGNGWTISSVTGLMGQLRVTGADLNLNMDPRVKKISDRFSESYVWSFTLQSDTNQSLPPYQYSTGTTLYPPGQIAYSALKRTAQVFGRYVVDQNVINFVFTSPPLDGFGPGWTITNLPGLSANSFRVVSYTAFNAQPSIGVNLDGNKISSLESWSPATSVLRVGDVIQSVNEVVITSQSELIQRVGVSGGIGSPIEVRGLRGTTPFSFTIPSTQSETQFAVLAPTDGSIPPNTAAPVYVNGSPSMMREPDFTSEFVPGTFMKETDEKAMETRINIDVNPSIIGNSSFKLRDLGTGLPCKEPDPGSYDDIKGRGFSSGSVLSLFAIGPQEDYLLTQDFTKSQWNPSFKRYTNSVMYQRVIPFPPASPSYQGQTVQLELNPTELGHLLSNMYLKVTMPALASGYIYTPQLGRALIKQVDLLVNETVIETLYDDWYVVRDQLFLDADEQTGMFQAVGSSNINAQVATDYIIPLEFFFCRRKSHADSGNERLRKPYFPLCAMWNQKLYVRFTFQPNTWWCNVAAPHTTDLVLPKLVTEEILLENAEKLYYTNTPLRYVVNRVKKESTLTFSAGNPQLQLTASFPVQSLAWFFRNKNYEDTSSGLYADSRYNYGYTTQYIQTGIQLQFPSGNANYIDVIDNAKITLNNIDILSTFQGSLYYTFKQPLEHGLSIPSKNIYTYSFGLTPKEYNQGGYLNFSKLNSHTTTLALTFNPSYASQITQGYNLYLFYYGYTLLEFQGGFARLPFV